MDKLLRELKRLERKSLEDPVPLGLPSRVSREAGLFQSDLQGLPADGIAVLSFTNLVIARRIRTRARKDDLECFFVLKASGQLHALLCLAEHEEALQKIIAEASVELDTQRARILTANHRAYLRKRLPRLRDDLLGLLCHYATHSQGSPGDALAHQLKALLHHPEIYVPSKVVDALRQFLSPLKLDSKDIALLIEALKRDWKESASLPKDFEDKVQTELKKQLHEVLSQVLREEFPSLPLGVTPLICQHVWEQLQKDEYDPYLKRKLGRGGLPELSWIAPIAVSLYLDQAAELWRAPASEATQAQENPGLLRQVSYEIPVKASSKKNT